MSETAATSGSVPLAAYGKLPLSREFLRFACENAALGRFRDFIDRAAPHWRARPEDGHPGVRLLFTPADGPATIVATLWPSADEGGRRPFPFGLFLAVERGELDPGAPCSAAVPVHTDHAQLHESFLQLADAAAFERLATRERARMRVPRLADGARAAWREAASGVPLRDWVESLVGEELESFAALLWRLRLLFAVSSDSQAGRAGIRFPLAPSLPLEVQADAWLETARAAGLHSPGGINMLLDPGSRESGDASLCAFLRPVAPADLALLAGGEVPGLADLTITRRPAVLDGFGRFSLALADRLETPGASLASLPDLLQQSGP